MAELIALDIPGGPEFVDHLLREWERGNAVLPIDQRLARPARLRLLETLAPSVIIDPSGSHRRSGGVPVLAGDALVVATSGTTGEPKGVVLTHEAVAASAKATNDWLGIDPTRDRWLATLPLAHIGGLSVVTRALTSDTPVTVLPSFDPAVTNAAVASGHTRTSLVVTALTRVRVAGWQTILVGGSSMPRDLPQNCVRTYGMTETGSGIVYNGRALRGIEVTLGDDGEIVVGGPTLFRAYRGADGPSSADPVGFDPKDALGRFRTGDVGRFDEQGVLEVFGRKGDVIVSGGEKVWPDAVERALAGLGGIAEFAVAAQPDEEWGNRVTLFVVPSPGATLPRLAEVRELVKNSIAGYAAPRAIVVIKSMPRTTSGKVDRKLLSALSILPIEHTR